MSLELLRMAVIGLGFGFVIAFWGYKLLWIILPIWGFFAGFALGAQTIQAIFSDAFMATITSWVVGFVVGAIFAVLSYLFYFIAVALLSGAFGYALAVGILTAIGLDFGFIVWLIGIVAGVIVAVAVIVPVIRSRLAAGRRGRRRRAFVELRQAVRVAEVERLPVALGGELDVRRDRHAAHRVTHAFVHQTAIGARMGGCGS